MSDRRSDKFTHDLRAVAATQCVSCRHRPRDATFPVCAAFPGGIPEAILANRADHRRPYVVDGEPQDTGITGERSITFAPRDGIDPAALATLYRTLDRLHA